MSTSETAVSEAIRRLRCQRFCISTQQYRTIKGQIVAGDVDGAMKGLDRITKRDGPLRTGNAQEATAKNTVTV